MRGISPEHSEASVLSEARASERNFSFSCADDNTRGAAPSIKKCHRGGSSEKTTNKAILGPAKTALTIFLKFEKLHNKSKVRVNMGCYGSQNK
jgi:hypothetical protein